MRDFFLSYFELVHKHTLSNQPLTDKKTDTHTHLYGPIPFLDPVMAQNDIVQSDRLTVWVDFLYDVIKP